MLDHVRIHGRQDNIGRQTHSAKGLIDMSAASKADVVGDQRPSCQLFQRQGVDLRQGVPLRHYNLVRPLITGKRYQPLELAESFGGNTDIGLARQYPLRNVLRRALLQGNAHLGKLRPKSLHHLG